MQFILDENILKSVQTKLNESGYECNFSREFIPLGSVDPLVAFLSEQKGSVLVSFDGDFKKIAPRVPERQRKRFQKLSRIHLRCTEFQAAQRLKSASGLIENEFDIAQNSPDQRMIIEVGKSYIKTQR
jgi:predicted nuclease of predicted toxin-antitoxin system